MLKKFSFLFLILWLVTITTLSLVDLSTIDIDLDTKSWIKLDKIIHFIFYFVFTALMINHYRNSNNQLKLVCIFLVAVFYGIIIEILQDIVPTKRSFDYLDILANTLGTTTVITVFLFILKKNKKKHF